SEPGRKKWQRQDGLAFIGPGNMAAEAPRSFNRRYSSKRWLGRRPPRSLMSSACRSLGLLLSPMARRDRKNDSWLKSSAPTRYGARDTRSQTPDRTLQRSVPKLSLTATHL